MHNICGEDAMPAAVTGLLCLAGSMCHPSLLDTTQHGCPYGSAAVAGHVQATLPSGRLGERRKDIDHQA